MNIFFLILGHLSTISGIIGIILPLIPATPFFLMATYFYSKSSPKFHNYITNHALIGPIIKDWQEKKLIPIRVKFLSVGSICFAIFFKILPLDINKGIKLSIIGLLSLVILYILSRKSR
jgi:uncharacterized membrane protein YbaN (DUF454 family)